MSDAPIPPADFPQRRITVVEFKNSLFRTHSIARNPIDFGTSGHNRFDSPDAKYGVLYSGRDPYCAFVETFGRAAGSKVVTTAALKSSALSELKSKRAIRLVDLTQAGALKRLGADSNLFAGSHSEAQLWSKAIHGHPAHVDGFIYPSRLDPTRHAIVLFDDRGIKLTELRRTGWYETGAQRRLLAEIVEHYGMELIDNQYVAGRKPVARAVQPSLDFER